MDKETFNKAKEKFDKEGYIHENIVKELFEIIEDYLTAKKEIEYIENEPGC